MSDEKIAIIPGQFLNNMMGPEPTSAEKTKMIREIQSRDNPVTLKQAVGRAAMRFVGDRGNWSDD